MPITLPAILVPRKVMFHQENTSRSGGESITGSEQVITSGGGRWRASMEFMLAREEWVLSWRALLAQLQGRARRIEISPYDAYNPSDANGRRLSPVGAATLGTGDNGGALLFDLSGLGQMDAETVTLAANASLRATRITVSAVSSWMVPRPGQYFGIGKRLYIVENAYRATEADPWTLDFSPPLREAATTGAIIITDRPMCTMRLASDSSGELSLDFSRWGSATLELVEAI
jgi:hypothetical protein